MGNTTDWNKVGAIGTWCFGIVGLAIYLFDRLHGAGNMPVTLAGWLPALLIALAIFGGAALHLKAATLGSRTGRLLIHSASYGVGGAWWQWWKYKNVTEIVRACVKNETIDVSVSNRIFGDPFKGDPKHLFVQYSHNGIAQRAVVPEGGRFSVPSSAAAEPNTLPNSPIVAATRQTFESLSVSQRFIVKEIYEHPGTAIAFLGTTLTSMKFAPRVMADSLNKVLTTNLWRGTPGIPGNAEPNPEVKDIVASLLEKANLPTPETVRQINEETATALAIDHNFGHEFILEQAKAEAAHERELLQSQLQVAINDSKEDREELQKAKQLVQKLNDQFIGRAVPGDAPRLLVSYPKNVGSLFITNDGSNGAVNVRVGPLVHVERHEIRPIYRPFGSIPAKSTEERKITVAQHQPNISGDLWSTVRDRKMDPDPVDFVDVLFGDLTGNEFQQRFTLISESEESVTWKPQAVRFLTSSASSEVL